MQPLRVDLAIVGAGVVGLAHAAVAVRLGMSVAVVERDDFACGASVRNFGHGCVTAQAGEALDYALVSRERWLELGKAAGFWVSEAGTVVVARAADEYAVLTEFAARTAAPVRLLDADQVRAQVPVNSPDVVGGAWLPLDIRVDPREAVPALARWLAEAGVTFRWGACATGVEPGVLHTSRGDVLAGTIVLAAGHDLDRLLPGLTDEIGMRRCALHMLRVSGTPAERFPPGRFPAAVLTGLSLLRYPGFADCPSLPAVRARFAAERPDLLAVDMNLMFTQLPDGDLVIGDTHATARTHPPFHDERVDDLVLAETASLLGVEQLVVRERWRGVYAQATGRNFLIATPLTRVHAVAVTTGIGMTTAHGLATKVLADVLS